MHVLLDAYAVLAVLRDEVASDEVAELVAKGSAVSTINAAEVLDRLCRTGAPEDEVKADLASVGAELLQPPGDVVVDAGLLRARHYHHRKRPVSLADCVAASHAIHLGVPLATSDGPLVDVLRAEGAAFTPLPDSSGRRPR